MLLESACYRAGLCSELGVDEVEAALQSSLEKRSAVVACTAGHVIRSHVRRCAPRRSQSYCEAARQIEEDFRHEIASVSETQIAVFLALAHKLIIGFLQQVLKVDQML